MASERIEVGDEVMIQAGPRKAFVQVYGPDLPELFLVIGDDVTGQRRVLFVEGTPGAVYASDCKRIRTKAQRLARQAMKTTETQPCGDCKGIGHGSGPGYQTCQNCNGRGRA